MSLRAIAVFAALALASPAVGQAADAAPSSPTPATAGVVVVPERALGQAVAPVTIDLYAAFICNECAAWYADVLPVLKAEYIDTGKARLVFHDVVVEPIDHSVKTAMIGLCADPAAFFDVAQVFMFGLPGIRQGRSSDGWYADAIAASGRAPTEMATCASSETTYEQVRTQHARAAALAFTTLPGVLVNGRIVPLPTADLVGTAIVFATAAGAE